MCDKAEICCKTQPLKDLCGLVIPIYQRPYEWKEDHVRHLVNDTYNAFLEKYEEIRITKSSAIGDASIIIISPAVEPTNPVAPNKKMNIAIAAVFGLMLGVFIAFFIEYWKTSAPQKS